jgi:hypothetical protein
VRDAVEVAGPDEFSLTLGGPLYQLPLRTAILRPPLEQREPLTQFASRCLAACKSLNRSSWQNATKSGPRAMIDV